MKIRGILFLLATLAGFPISTFAAESCELRAYVIDKDPKGLNVRSAPNPKAPVVAVLPLDGNGTIVEARGSEAGWIQIVQAENIEGTQVFHGKGWVFAGLLGTSTRFSGPTPIHAQANLKSPVVGKISGEQELTLKGCREAWPKVKWKSLEGFLPPDQNCPNPVTTCP